MDLMCASGSCGNCFSCLERRRESISGALKSTGMSEEDIARVNGRVYLGKVTHKPKPKTREERVKAALDGFFTRVEQGTYRSPDQKREDAKDKALERKYRDG